MLHSLQALASAAVMERTILLANHVIAAEPVAMQRLQPHAGRCLLLTLQGWPTLAAGIMLFSGVQLMSIGILGEYIGRMYEELKQRPLYIVRRAQETREQGITEQGNQGTR